ncbi:MAG: pyocin knob domain-containing protein [Kiritimatiellales bacterium]
MNTLPEIAEWTPGIYQLEIDDPVQGGAEGIDNLQAKQLAARTLWLKKKIESAFIGAGDGKVLLAEGDWNEYTNSGFFAGKEMANAPRDSLLPHLVQVFAFDDYVVQLSVCPYDGSLWLRSFSSNEWWHWERQGEGPDLITVGEAQYLVQLYDDRAKYVTINPTVKSTLLLPAADGGERFTFIRANSAGIRVQAPAGVSINGSPPGGYIEAVAGNERTASVVLVAVSDILWVAIGGLGTWHESRGAGLSAVRVFGIITNSGEATPAGGDFSGDISLV